MKFQKNRTYIERSVEDIRGVHVFLSCVMSYKIDSSGGVMVWDIAGEYHRLAHDSAETFRGYVEYRDKSIGYEEKQQ